MNRTTAAVAACALLVVGAAVSYVVGDASGRLTGTVALQRPLKSTIPATLGGWTGRDDPLPESTLLILKCDDHLRRQYRDAAGNDVLLSVAYHGNKERGMQSYYHNATVCFPAQGWTQESEKLGTETLSDVAKEVPVCRYVFAKGGEKLSVLTFFKVDDEFLDQSPRNKPFWMLLDRVAPKFDDRPGTFVQVQIIAPVGAGGEYAAADLESRFLRDFGRRILGAVEIGAPE